MKKVTDKGWGRGEVPGHSITGSMRKEACRKTFTYELNLE